MKGFFYTVFGGLLAIGTGIGVVYGGVLAWNGVRPHIAGLRLPVQDLSLGAVANAVISRPVDGTSISGWKRVIRYTGAEEEGIIEAAALSLPAAPDSGVTARAYVVKNLLRGDVATEYNTDKILPIASLTKLATAVVARRLIDPDENVTITPEIMATYGNTAFFRTGEVFRAADLLYPLLMVSSNDAAEALARDYGREKFLAVMNDWTHAIGAYSTYFADPSGLSPQNVSTANDLAIMIDWIRKHDPEVFAITQLKTKTVRGHTWTNPTHFLNWSSYAGGKNGYTDEANRTAASLFALGSNGNPYAVIVLGSDNRDADVVRLLEKVK
jgi:D-alanyl-D-alanine carboxypeptidase